MLKQFPYLFIYPLVLSHTKFMEPQEYYRQRLATVETELGKLRKKKSALGWLRLANITILIGGIYLLIAYGVGITLIFSVVILFIFSRLLQADLANNDAISHLERVKKVNEDELHYLAYDYLHFPGGENFSPPGHLYANDLDIFGRASLYQFINRTQSEIGNARLASYLLGPAEIQEIRSRQQASRELVTRIEWVQDLIAKGLQKKVLLSTSSRVQLWAQQPPVFSMKGPWKYLRYLLPAVIISIVVLFALDLVGKSLFYLGLLTFAAIAYQLNKKLAPVHDQLNRIAKEMDGMSASLSHIEQREFRSPLLEDTRAKLTGENSASDNIRGIKKILDRLDLQLNLVLSASLNILLLWNLQQVMDLEKWKAKHKDSLAKWFDALAEMEAISSLAILHFNQPGWYFPQVKENYFHCEAKKMGHPLISPDKRVDNDALIRKAGEIKLVTGSNMAGKSTYLRSIGVNAVMALAGASVCAESFTLSHVQVVSSMRITDNLEESTSTFYAELKKLKTIIEMVNAKEKVLILLDEILRGTNSLDRHTGSVALLKQLIHHNAPGVIATHDLQLASLAKEFPDDIHNYHFDVQVQDDELFFDYKLKPGICNSLNASILMRKIGIEL